MPVQTVSSWRELDDAVAAAGAAGDRARGAHSSLVFRGLARSTYSNRSSLARLGDGFAAHELLPARLRRALDEEGATVFTTELLAEHAPTLEALDRLAGEDPFVLFFEPPSLDDRIVNQSAVLSAMSDPAVSMDGWLEENPGLWYAWRITPAGKAEIRARLDQGNVNERVLLPGLDGLAAWLRRYYAPASGDDALQDGARMGDPVAARGTGQGEED
jgi:hypothetical protein